MSINKQETSNKTMLTFLGQAGFIIEGKNGYRMGIDLYLSDCCNRYFGFKRLLPFMYDPLSLQLDLLAATHAHYDHFDPDSVPLIMDSSNARLLAAYDVKAEAEKLNLDRSRIMYMKTGDVFENENVRIKAMACDHGKDTPDAVGLLIEIDGKRIYIAGDTAFREDYFTSSELKNIDIFILPINGAFGNMNEIEGAKAAGIIRAGLTIPCHYWNFAEHGGNPGIFAKEMDKNYPELKYIVMRPDEKVRL